MNSIFEKYKNLIGASTGAKDSSGSSNPQMVALDKNYAAQSQNALEKYTVAQKQLEESRVRAKNDAVADNAKLMKYMPSILKRQGLSGLGVSQSAVINANSKFGERMAGIESDFQKSTADLLQNYNDAKLSYDTQYNTQKAQLEQKALDEEKAAKEKAETEAKAKNNEIAGNLEAMISGSAAKSMDELISELGIVLSEGENFNTYVDSLGLDTHVASYLKSMAAQKVSANNTAYNNKLLEDLDENARDLMSLIDRSTATDLVDLMKELGLEEQDFNAYVDSLGFEADTARTIKSKAAQKVSANGKTISDNNIAEILKQAENLIMGDTLSTDFSQLLAEVEAAGVSDSDYNYLARLAALKVAENEAAREEINDGYVLDDLLQLEALEDWEKALEVLEAVKGQMSSTRYAQKKVLYESYLKSDEDDSGAENPFQKGPGYKDMSDSDKEARTINGEDPFVHDGQIYRINQKNNGEPFMLEEFAPKMLKSESFKKQLSEAGGFNGPKDANIPNGFTFAMECDINTMGHIVRAKPYVTYYNGNWYVSTLEGKYEPESVTNSANSSTQTSGDLAKYSTYAAAGGGGGGTASVSNASNSLENYLKFRP